MRHWSLERLMHIAWTHWGLSLYVLAWNMRRTSFERVSSWEPAMIIFMKKCRKSKTVKRAELVRRYDEELLFANWNPAVGLIPMSCRQSFQKLGPQHPEDLTDFDAKEFLDRVYELASQN